MIDTLEIYEELKTTLDPQTAKKLAELWGRIYKELSNTVTKAEFNELKDVVRELVEAQKKTEARIEDLVEAQKRTEVELKEFRKSTEEEFRRVWTVIGELTEAQKRTETRVNELAEAQRKTEQRVNELAEAQRKTEQTLNSLIKEFKAFKRQVGDITDTVGYNLENASYRALPGLLKRDYGIEVKGRLKRGYLKDRRGRYLEVNILGEGRKNGKEVLIVGESKTRLSKKGVREFIKERLRRFEGLYGEIFPVLVTHMISEHDVEEYAKEHNIALYYSYDFEYTSPF